MAALRGGQWAEQCRAFRRTINASDDDLRSFTLGAIRAVARDPNASVEEIRAFLDGLDEALHQ